MRYTIFLFSILCILLLINPVWAQLNQPYRLELVTKHSDHDFQVISMGKEGLALVRDLEKYSKGKKKWQLEIVDTTLTSVWSTEIELETRLSLVGYEHSPGHLFLLFREEETTYYNFRLATILIAEKSIHIDKVQFDLTFRLTHFTVANNSAIFGGYVNSEPAVLLYDASSDHPKILPGLFTEGLTLLDVRTNQNQSFNVLLKENKGSNQSKLIVRTFDNEGNLIIDDIIDVAPRYNILSGITSTLIHDEMMIAGTFGEGSGKQAVGFYSVLVDPFSEQSVTYTDFGSLEHFLDYLPEKKSGKIKARAQKDKSTGKSFAYKANVFPFRLAELSGAFYLFAEMFHPSTTVYSYPYGNPSRYNDYTPFQTQNYSNGSGRFDNPPNRQGSSLRNTEVRLIQSVVLKFGKPNAAPMDIAMKMKDMTRPILEQTSDFLLSSDSIVLAFKEKNEIQYQKESNDLDINPSIAKAYIRLTGPEDIFKDEIEEGGGLRFWYDSHFYAWGYQRIKKEVDNDIQTLYVFYVNRVDL